MLSNDKVSVSGIVKKTLISITLALSLIMSFAFSSLAAQALPVSSNVGISADFAKEATENIGNLGNGILIAGKGKSKKLPEADLTCYAKRNCNGSELVKKMRSPDNCKKNSSGKSIEYHTLIHKGKKCHNLD